MIDFERVRKYLNKNETVFEKVINDNGTMIQSVIAIEEIAELQSAFMEFISNPNKGIHCKENLSEEIADVLICIKQLQLMYGLPDDIYVITRDYSLVRVSHATIVLAELQKSISKTVRCKNTDLQESIAEAIQVVNYYSFATKPEKLEEWLDKKVERLKNMHMGEGKS